MPGSGTGLIGLAERLELAGGRLEWRNAAGEFRLSAWLPWPEVPGPGPDTPTSDARTPDMPRPGAAQPGVTPASAAEHNGSRVQRD